MSAWGANAKSCKSLLDRVERNDPNLTELFILPTKVFGGTEVERLAHIFDKESNTHLKKLSASGHKVPNGALFVLGKAIASSTTPLRSLAIGDNSMGHTGILALTKGLKEGGGGKIPLEEVDLSYKGIGIGGLEMILNTLDSVHCPKLCSLNLSRNELIGQDLSGTTNATTCSFASTSHIKQLDLSQCGLSGRFVADFFACFEQQTDCKTNLTELHLEENPLQKQGFEALLPLLQESSLLQLNISHCEIGNEAIQSLPTTTGTPNLQILDLSSNGLTTQGATVLSDAMANPNSCLANLVELNLAGNMLGEEGVQHLAGALDSSGLKKLDLTNTNCGTQGAMDILTKANHLQSLHLFNNSLGSDGFVALAPTLRGGHATLELLDLGGNGANQASVVVLLASLLEGGGLMADNQLRVLVVGGNEGGDAVEQMVAQIQQADPKMDIARDKKAHRAQR